MKKFFVLLAVAVVTLSSATVVPSKSGEPNAKMELVANSLNTVKADGKITKKELYKIATDAKGSKLSFKEKVALKIFGKKIGDKLMKEGGSGKSQLAALLICFFVGGLGIHRFYLGYTWQGVVQLLTLGGCGIWSLIDFIRICIGDLKPNGGDYEKTL
jgi:TM2 domain-containing membrane protein YozV